MENGLNPGRTGLSGQPVWKSQVMSPLLSNRVKKRPSGVKLKPRSQKSVGVSKMLSLLRVTESRISVDPVLRTAINLPHGDHTPTPKSPRYLLAETGSHESGDPCMTLARGQAYCLNSPRTIEVWGDRRSAE